MGQDNSTDPKATILSGRYQIVRTLGRGGIGKVFLANDLQTGQQVALKMLRTKFQDNSKVIARFTREVNAVRQLNHPGIVKIFDAKRDGELLFYTMEYVDGKSVRQWLQERGHLKVDSTVRVLSLIAHALEHAHRITIHRDLSPENVMVMRDGSIRLLDFGLAKLEDAYDGLTMIGATLGKIAYSAPEQRRSAADVDARSDLYSLGVMFYEMLTGHLPKGRPLKEFRPDLPDYFSEFYEKATNDDPGKRFQNAREFRHALQALFHRYQGHETATDIAAGSETPPEGIPSISPEEPTLLRKPSLWRRLRDLLSRFKPRK